MNEEYFDDIPGVGQIRTYRENGWLDRLAFRLLAGEATVPVQDLGDSVDKHIAEQRYPILKFGDGGVKFVAEKYAVGAVLVPTYEAIRDGDQLDLLNSLMPYDHICYLRPAIEGSDAPALTRLIEESHNDHYSRLLFMMLRRCASDGNSSWYEWTLEFVRNLAPEIKSYAGYTVQRDARVTLSALSEDQDLFEFVDRLLADSQLAGYERQHFRDSLPGPDFMIGDFLVYKLSQSGYRKTIAPINVFGLSLFPSPRTEEALKAISIENESQKLRSLAEKLLSRSAS